MRPAAPVLVFLALAATAAAQAVDQEVLIQALTSSSAKTKREAVNAALNIPAAKRAPALQLALDQEFIRYVRASERPKPEGTPKNLNPEKRGRRGRGEEPETPATPKAEEAAMAAAEQTDYLLSLIDAIQPSTNADLIPSLLKVIDSGEGVTNALARFGDRAVPGLLTTARSSPRGTSFTEVLITFRTMGERGVQLSPARRAEVVSFLTEVIEGPTKEKTKGQQDKNEDKQKEREKEKGGRGGMALISRAFDAATALEAGVALGDPGLRKLAESIANDEKVAAKYGGSGPGGSVLLQQKARDALLRYPK
jgi:hypothetical protein